MFCPGCKVFSHGTGGISCDIKDIFLLTVLKLVTDCASSNYQVDDLNHHFNPEKTSLALARQFSCQWFLED